GSRMNRAKPPSGPTPYPHRNVRVDPVAPVTLHIASGWIFPDRKWLAMQNLKRRTLVTTVRGLALGTILVATIASPMAQAPAAKSWDESFRALPQPANLKSYMQRLSARPHHVGSPYDKDNAEWILAKFKEWGLDAKIETFDVLFPTPKERALELVAPSRFTAKLAEPAQPGDPTSSQHQEQLPTYNAYSIDGDVTAPLVYVNFGVPEDYETLERMGISV